VDEKPYGNADAGPPSGSNGHSTAESIPLGRYSGKLDDKGRLKLPVKFQEYINTLPGNKDLFITSLDRKTAAIYAIDVWRENLKRLAAFRDDDDAVSVVKFNANDLGTEERMDGQGRVLLNSDLREALGLEDKSTLHMVALNGHIEVITDTVYKERKAEALAGGEKAAKKLFGQGLE
jgi:DNA-binding transcriptional regulator/RsmH inhibitor MraZ